MAITYVGGGQDDRGSTTDLTPTLPSHAADDFCIATCCALGSGRTFTETASSGWSVLDSGDDTIGGNTYTTYLFYKKFTSGSETNPVFGIDAGGGGTAHACALGVWRGVDTTTPFDATYVQATEEDTATPNQPDITTTTSGACVVAILQAMWSPSTISAHTPPSGYTLGESVIDVSTNPAIAYLLDSGSAGSKTPGTWSFTGGASTDDYIMITIALRDADAGGSSIIPQAMNYYARQMRG